MLVPVLLFVALAQHLRIVTGLVGGGQPRWRRDLVGAIPGDGIVLEGRHEPGQLVFEAVPRLPAEQPPRRADVESIVIVGHIDHEWPNERFLALVERIGDNWLERLLRPSAHLGQRLGHFDGGPVGLAVDRLADRVLDRVVAHRLRFTDQEGDLPWQLRPPVDDPAEGVDHVVLVQHALADLGVAGVQPALQVALVDAGDLLGERGHGGAVVVQPGEVQQGDGDPAVFLSDHRLRLGLRSRIGPFRLERLALVDALARPTRTVNQHRAGIDELFDLEVLQRVQQAARALNVHRPIQRIVLTGEVEVGGEMNDAGDVAAVALAQLPECRRDLLV
jgi:hypothetical protein